MRLRSALCALCATTPLLANVPGMAEKHLVWIASWAAAQQIPEPQNQVSSGGFEHAQLRQIVHLSAGGPAIRVHLSNAFGALPLRLSRVHVARAVSPDSAAIVPATDHPVLFDGHADVTIPAGAEYISDTVQMPVAALSDLAVSIETTDAPQTQTGHPGSRATSYLTHSSSIGAPDLPGAQPIEHWYLLSGIDVASPPEARAIVALGDSITDGHGATVNGNDRWTDQLARRLQGYRPTQAISVINEGIGGNHLLTDGLGPSALARFDRDVLAQPGARYVIVLEGVNDVGGATIKGEISPDEHEALVGRILGAYRQMIERAHARGFAIYGATITPYSGSDYYHPGPASEADRVKVNSWIRAAGHFDGCIDFSTALADPEHPDRLLPVYDSGDHLHPSPAGYRRLAATVPLRLFVTQ